MYDDRALVGVGGWLAFFVIIMAAFTPLRVVVTLLGNLYGDPAMAAAYGKTWPVIQAFEWLLAVLSIGGAWYLVWRLMNVEIWQTMRVTIAGIWLLSIGLNVVETLGISLIAGIPLGRMLAGIAPEMIQPIAFAIIWTAYFLRSRRVANTYVREADPDDVAEVFG